MKGKILFYITVKEADAIITGNKYRGIDLTITGKLYRANNALFVESIDNGIENDFEQIPHTSGSGVPEL